MLLGTSELSKFNLQTNNGIYNIDEKLNLRIRVKAGWIKIGQFKPKIKCGLKVPLSSIGKSTGSLDYQMQFGSLFITPHRLGHVRRGHGAEDERKTRNFPLVMVV